MVDVCICTGWMPEYVEDNLTTTLQKALDRKWEKCLPLAVAASMLCQYVGVWKPRSAYNDHSELAGMGGLTRG